MGFRVSGEAAMQMLRRRASQRFFGRRSCLLRLPRFYLVDCGGAAFRDWGLGSRAWGLEFRPRSGLSVCGLGLQMQGACAHSPSKEEGACFVHWYTYISWRFLPLLEPPKGKHANLVKFNTVHNNDDALPCPF